MVCQKCGLQPAVVHLETQVYRQRIEEHLCVLCAGARIPKPTPDEITAQLHKFFDPIAEYLQLVGRKPVLTPANELVLWEQIETNESQAKETISKIPALAKYLAAVGTRLLRGNEHFERVVAEKRIENREAYLKGLPRLVKAMVKHEAELGRVWKKAPRAKPGIERNRLLQRQRAHRTSLAAIFPKLHFKLKIYEVFLAELRPTLKQIEKLHGRLTRGEASTGKEKTGGEVRKMRRRLDQIEAAQRMSANDLLMVADQSSEWIRLAHRTKTQMVEAHLWLVIIVAKNFDGHGLSLVDLIIEGNVGLRDAVERFNHRTAGSFQLFATRAIVEAIAKALLDRPTRLA